MAYGETIEDKSQAMQLCMRPAGIAEHGQCLLKKYNYLVVFPLFCIQSTQVLQGASLAVPVADPSCNGKRFLQAGSRIPQFWCMTLIA